MPGVATKSRLEAMKRKVSRQGAKTQSFTTKAIT
jgi:hypothetical protein